MSFIMSWDFYALSVNCASIFCNSLRIHVRHTSALVCQSNLSLCLCPVRTKEEALLQPFMARSHPPRTPASMTNTILGHDDHSWINGCDGDDIDDDNGEYSEILHQELKFGQLCAKKLLVRGLLEPMYLCVYLNCNKSIWIKTWTWYL